MKASHIMGLLFICAMAPAIAQAEDNPFIPADPGGSLGQIERRLNDLEMRIQQSEMRSEEQMMNSQYPGIRMDESGSQMNEIMVGDVALGKVNGKCVVRRGEVDGQVIIEAIEMTSPCVTPAPDINSQPTDQ